MRERKPNEKTWEGEFEILDESPMAMKLWDGEGRSNTHYRWVPKSQIFQVSPTHHPTMMTVEMTAWIAEQKGFV